MLIKQTIVNSISEIHAKLGFEAYNGLYLEGTTDGSSKKIEKLLSDPLLKPHSYFLFENKPFVVFYDDPSNLDDIFKAIWNLNEVPIVVIHRQGTVDIYNGFEYLKEQATLSLLGHEERLTDFAYFNLVTGITWEKYSRELSYKNRVDYKLLENIKDARNILINDCQLNEHTANALLGKCIFTRYLIDRKVQISFNTGPIEWTNEEFCNLLKDKINALKFFDYLQESFNGDLFTIEDPNGINEQALNAVSDLLRGVVLKTGQLSLFDIFDFSIIPVEFISNVYELFIGQDEQAKSGAYYTPLFLVEYITSQTVQEFLKKSPKNSNCRVFDPACGSGIFLVEALRQIIENFNSQNNNINSDSEEYRNSLRKLAEDNIFGIDRDKSAVSVAIFSVYLTLLDYQHPKDITKFKFPKLLDKNFFVADFFDEQHKFNKIIKTANIDFIVGNPPWKRGVDTAPQLFLAYIKRREAKESSKTTKINISNKEIAQAFLLRVSDFSKENQSVSLIVTSKVLYNLNAFSFRKYFLENFLIDKVFELSPVRREVFNKSNDPSIAPATILFYRYANGKATGANVITHYSLKPNRFFSLFNLFLLQRNDVKTIKQSLLMENDWLWKILLFGNFMDYNLIQRLKEYKTIEQRSNEKGYLVGQGFQIGKDKNPIGADIKHLKYLPHDRVLPFYVACNLIPLEAKTLHRVRNPRLYFGTRLLIKKGLTNSLRAVSAISNEDFLFKDTLTAIKIDKAADTKDLQIIMGLMQTELFSYFAFHKFSSIGVEREQGFNKEKFAFPFIEDNTIADVVQKIEVKRKEDFKTLMSFGAKELTDSLNDLTFKAFNLSEAELATVDYTINYLIPSTFRISNFNLFAPVEWNDIFLNEYVSVYINRLSEVVKKLRNIQVNVLYSEHIIGISIEILPKIGNESGKVEWKRLKNTEILKDIIRLGHSKITEKLFIQKDIRGFGTDSFYIFKPNEKRVWHKAFAYLDLNYFVDAILKAGKKNESF